MGVGVFDGPRWVGVGVEIDSVAMQVGVGGSSLEDQRGKADGMGLIFCIAPIHRAVSPPVLRWPLFIQS